jgi:hypothetical protein
VPLDVTAVAVAQAVEAGDLGRAYWLCYGETAMTPAELQNILVEHARQSGQAINAVPIVDPTGELPMPLADLPATSRAFVKALADASEMTQSWDGVLPISLPLLRDKFDIPETCSADALRLSLKYWAERRATGAEPWTFYRSTRTTRDPHDGRNIIRHRASLEHRLVERRRMKKAVGLARLRSR